MESLTSASSTGPALDCGDGAFDGFLPCRMKDYRNGVHLSPLESDIFSNNM